MGKNSVSSTIEGVVFVEQPGEVPMAPAAARRALALLARWETRRARKLARLEGGGGDGLVTGLLSSSYKLSVVEN